jgi:hypothetical protein
MISFRVTEEEHDRFRALCNDRGLCSVSELARAAIGMLLEQSQRLPLTPLEARVARLEDQVQRALVQLTQLNQDLYAGTGTSAFTEE